MARTGRNKSQTLGNSVAARLVARAATLTLLCALQPPATCRADTPSQPESKARFRLDDQSWKERPSPEPVPSAPGGSWLGSALAVDLKDLATSPLRATKRDWAKAGAALGIVGAVHLLDNEIRSGLDPQGESGFAETIRPFGNEGSLVLLAGAWVAGWATGNQKAVSIGRDGLQATILSAGVLVPVFKAVTGRERPHADMGSSEFGGSGESFPSGEVTQAFTIASVVAAHSDKKWLDALAYTLASAVAWQRLETDKHWASDVAAGVLLGTTVGRWVVRRNRLRGWRIQPEVGSRSVGVTVQKSF